jgi:hypothetical protein
LYLPEWNIGDNLIFWSKIDVKGTSYLNFSTGVSEIRMKNITKQYYGHISKMEFITWTFQQFLGMRIYPPHNFGIKPQTTHLLNIGFTLRKSTTMETFFPSACQIFTILPVRFLIQNTKPPLQNP